MKESGRPTGPRGVDPSSRWDVAREAYDLLTAQLGYSELLAADGDDPGHLAMDRLEIDQARRQLDDLVGAAVRAGSVTASEAARLHGTDLEAARAVAREILASEAPPWARGGS